MTADAEERDRAAQQLRRTLDPLYREIGRVIVGQKALIDGLLLALLTGGHILLEGVPGLAKTLAVRTVARGLRLSFHRIQFTPDLLPADVIGTQIYKPRARQGAKRPPGSHAGKPGHHRRHQLPPGAALSRPGDAKPDRAGGDLSL